MLMTFPEFLFLAPLVGTLLRLVVGLSLLYIAYVQLKRRDEIGQMSLPIIGPAGAGLVTVAASFKAIVGLALIIGYATQLAALLALALCLKQFIYAKRYPRAVPLCRVDYFYLIVMCISLFLMGAGAFAFDLPL